MKEISEMDAAELGDALWDISDRLLELHEAEKKGSCRGSGLWEAYYRVKIAWGKVREALAEGGFK